MQGGKIMNQLNRFMIIGILSYCGILFLHPNENPWLILIATLIPYTIYLWLAYNPEEERL